MSSTQICSVKSVYRKCSTKLAYTKKSTFMLCSYQYGTIASKSRISARVNKTQCLPYCHSLLFHAASSEPILEGNDTAAGSCCNVALDIDATDKRSTLNQKPVPACRKNRMSFQCSDASLSWKHGFTFSLKAMLSFQSGCVAHLAKFSYMLSWYFRKPLSPVLQVQQNLFFLPVKWFENLSLTKLGSAHYSFIGLCHFCIFISNNQSLLSLFTLLYFSIVTVTIQNRTFWSFTTIKDTHVFLTPSWKNQEFKNTLLSYSCDMRVPHHRKPSEV